MRTSIIALLIILFVQSAETAIAEIGPDVLGLFFEEEGWTVCNDTAHAYSALPLYIILLNPTFSELHGWEAQIHSTSGELVSGGYDPVIYGGGTNAASGYEFRVTCEEPLVTTTATVLAKVWVLYYHPEECLFLTGVPNPSLADPNPLVWPTMGDPVPVGTLDFWENGIDAVIGACGGCADEVSAGALGWDALKARFR